MECVWSQEALYLAVLHDNVYSDNGYYKPSTKYKVRNKLVVLFFIILSIYLFFFVFVFVWGDEIIT